MNIDITYTANNGTEKVLLGVEEDACDKYRQGDKYYQIDHSGQYPLLQVACMGKCNTYWRTIGRYPDVQRRRTT